jgi:hypothetical protein
MQPDAGYGGPNRFRWFRVLRWVMVAGAAAIAVILILRKDYVLGILIGAMAMLRLALLVGTRRRRFYRWSGGSGSSGHGMPGPGTDGPYSRHAGAGGVPGGPGAGRFLPGLARSEFIVAAGVIGMDPIQVRRSYNQGRSLAEMAAGAGVPLERVVSAIVSDAGAKIDDAVATGVIPERRGVRFKSRLPIWADRLVEYRRRDFQAAS